MTTLCKTQNFQLLHIRTENRKASTALPRALRPLLTACGGL